MRFSISLAVALVPILLSAIGYGMGAEQQATSGKITEGDHALVNGRFSDAERPYLEALEEAKMVPETVARQAIILNALATVYNMEGRYREAEVRCVQGLAILETTRGKDDSVTATLLSTLGSIYLHLLRYGEAERLIRRAILIHEKHLTEGRPDLMADYTTLAVILAGEERYKQAQQTVESAAALCGGGESGCEISLAVANTALAKLYLIRKRYGDSEECNQRALTILEGSLGPSNSMLVPVLAGLASLYIATKRYPEAEAYGRRAFTISPVELANSDALAEAAIALAQGLAGQRRIESAEPYFQRALAIHERTQGRESIEYAQTLQQYARFLRNAKRITEARDVESHAAMILARTAHTIDVSEFPRHE